jgi:hypothetical protein
VAGVALACSRLGLRLLGVGEPIVEAHRRPLHLRRLRRAGLAASVAARRPRWISVGRVAIALTAAAPIVIATGFVVHSPIAQVGAPS